MSELYYAEMEAARNEAEDAYFKARPQLIRSFAEQALFRAGFERAFRLLWNPSGEAGRRAGVGPGGRAGQDCAGETRPAELGSTLETVARPFTPMDRDALREKIAGDPDPDPEIGAMAPDPTCGRCGAVLKVLSIDPGGWINFEPHECPTVNR